MKKVSINIFVGVVLWLIPSLIQASLQQDPLLVCSLMIKNEAPVIEKTLQPLIDGGIDSFLIYDTGSTDNTIEIVKNVFAANSVANYVIEQEEFVDFSTSRNRALDLTEEYFPGVVFILMPDAEWILHNVPLLLNFCKKHAYDTYTSYLIRLVQNGGFEFDVDRLIKARSGVRFRSPVHEYLETSSRSKLPKDVYFEYNQTNYGAEKSKNRYERDLKLLLKEYAQNPKEPRTLFYLAQTYETLGDYKNAYRFYELRTDVKGWGEENFMAMYRLAGVVERLSSDDVDKKTMFDWPLAQWYYLKAFSMRPSRIEPIVRIALHYLKEGKHALSYLFATRASHIDFPHNDILFVEKDMYTYTRYDILGQSAWYIGEYNVGEWALKKALKKHKEKSHLNSNLSFYIEKRYAQSQWGVRSIDFNEDHVCGKKPSKCRRKEWSILLCTLVERNAMFDGLVTKLKNQIIDAGLEDKLEILYFLDDRDFPIGFKRNKLLQDSAGTYVNFIDDDDEIHDNYITMIYDKFQENPDCVSLVGIITQDGKNPRKFVHSIEYDHYYEQGGVYYRPPNHLNPIKREYAVRHKFQLISWHEDFWWAVNMAKSNILKTEAKLNEPYYFYKCMTK